MKKFIGLLFIILLSIGGFGVMASEGENTIHYVVTNPGVDTAHEMRFNWQCFEEGSYLLLTTVDDVNFEKAMRLNPNEEIWSTKGLQNALQDTTFYTKERYVCKTQVKDLKERTRYMYKVVAPSCESEIYHFTTSGKVTEWNFVAFADFQYGKNKISHNLIDTVRKMAGNPTLVVCSGDMTDTSGDESEWEWFLDNPQFEDFIYASAPGDHEYWASYVDQHAKLFDAPHAYNSMFNNPQNGSEEAMNSSFYFYYNNVLFFMLDMDDSDTVTSSKLTKEQKWFKETVDKLEGTYQYLVVLMHKSIYSSYTNDSRVASTMRPSWYKVFDYVKADLVISGHDHMYDRTYKLYGNGVSKDDTVGTYYLDLGSSGDKTRSPDSGISKDGLHQCVLDLNQLGYACGAEVNVTDKGLSVKIYNNYGKVVDSFYSKSSRTITNEKPVVEVNPNDFKDLATLTMSSPGGTLTVQDAPCLVNVKTIRVEHGSTKNLIMPFSYGSYEHVYDNLSYMNYTNYKIVYVLLDDSEISFDYNLNMFDYASVHLSDRNDKLTLTWKKTIKDMTNDSFDIYEGKTLIASVANADLEKASIELPFKYLIGDHTFKLVSSSGFEKEIEYKGHSPLVLDTDEVTLDINDYTYVYYTFDLSDAVEIETEDSNVISLDGDMITAISPGEAIVTVKIKDTDLSYTMKIIVNEPPKKGGCGSSKDALAIMSIFGAALILIIKRRNSK